MMSIPFFTAALAMVLGWSGLRTGAVWFTVLTIVATVALFALHATDAINIDL